MRRFPASILALIAANGHLYSLMQEGVIETVRASNPRAARAAAKEILADGDYYPDRYSTIWIDGYLSGPGMYREMITVAIDPEEPDCADGEVHRWGDERVSGSGGGVCITEVCGHCACKKIIDTWAQRPDTGEQGLHSLAYEVRS